MADYRDLAAALGAGYGQDTGPITADTLQTLKSGYRSPNFLGMLADIGRGSLSNLESLVRGGAAQVPGTAGDIEALARMGLNKSFGAGGVNVNPETALPTTADIMKMLPQRMTQARPETAGMEELGTVIGPGLGKAVKPLAKTYGNLALEDIAMASTGQPTRSLLGDITPKPKFIFMGENSKTWNKDAADTAVKMEKAGASPEDIWAATGTFRGAEGKLRQEISDQNLSIQDYRNTGGAIVIKHPELQAAYEQLPQGVKVRPTSQFEDMAAYEAPKREFDWQMGEGGTIHVPSTQVMPKDVYAHELQHAVQAKEGFAKGGSPDRMVLILEKLAQDKRDEAQKMFDLSSNKDPLNPQIIKPGARKKGLELEKQAREIQDKISAAYHSEQTKFDLYKKLAGEAEARAVESRLNMTPEQRRAKFPYESYDVLINDLILRK